MSTTQAIVTACDKRFLWGACLLIASLRKNNINIPITVVIRGFTNTDKDMLNQFDNILCIESDLRTSFAQTDKPQALLSASGAEYITWLDADCIVNGDVSELLIPIEPKSIMIRFRDEIENKLRFNSGKESSAIPEKVQEVWKSDIANSASRCRIHTTCVTNAFTIHKEHFPLIREWESMIMAVAQKYGSNFPQAYCHSSGSGLSDELILNSLFAFKENAPPVSSYRLNVDRQRCLLHFGLNPKPWNGWTWSTLRYFDLVISLIEWLKEQGYGTPHIPWHLRPGTKLPNLFLAGIRSLGQKSARTLPLDLRKKLKRHLRN
ncbi:MAG: hypothetical protein KC643_28790 [Nitrospira sp.]|nr:hypothetical protein [Nitrospira sp.]